MNKVLKSLHRRKSHPSIMHCMRLLTDVFVACYVLAVEPKDAGLHSNSITQNIEYPEDNVYNLYNLVGYHSVCHDSQFVSSPFSKSFNCTIIYFCVSKPPRRPTHTSQHWKVLIYIYISAALWNCSTSHKEEENTGKMYLHTLCWICPNDSPWVFMFLLFQRDTISQIKAKA